MKLKSLCVHGLSSCTQSPESLYLLLLPSGSSSHWWVVQHPPSRARTPSASSRSPSWRRCSLCHSWWESTEWKGERRNNVTLGRAHRQAGLIRNAGPSERPCRNSYRNPALVRPRHIEAQSTGAQAYILAATLAIHDRQGQELHLWTCAEPVLPGCVRARAPTTVDIDFDKPMCS